MKRIVGNLTKHQIEKKHIFNSAEKKRATDQKALVIYWYIDMHKPIR